MHTTSLFLLCQLLQPLRSDLVSIESLSQQLFAHIFFQNGKSNMAQIQTLFLPEGQLIRFTAQEMVVQSVGGFIRGFEELVATGELTSLHEVEVRSETKIFGHIAHRYSMYESRFRPEDPEPFEVGVNSIQFVKKDGQWFISTMSWDALATDSKAFREALDLGN